MSIESARDELVEAIFDSWRLPADQLRERVYRVECHQMPIEHIDRLILEVQAAMPCYMPAELRHSNGTIEMRDCTDIDIGPPEPPPCPSCKARQALKEDSPEEARLRGLSGNLA